MVPPLKHPYSLLVTHPAFPWPVNALALLTLRDRVRPLADTEFARKRKTVTCPRKCAATVHEHRATNDAGPIRVYFCMVAGNVVLLLWGDKSDQSSDIADACRRAHEVLGDPASWLARCATLA